MKITPVAHTFLIDCPEETKDTEFGTRNDVVDIKDTSEIDLLAEMAGRACYKSWSLPNPATATNEGYIANILNHEHYSVLEHGTVTFWVEGVSRALLLELERHRFSSYSVESQRYVDTRKYHPEPVYAPLWDELPEGGVVQRQRLLKHYESSLEQYGQTYNEARDAGFPVKVAREAARAFLLESTPVDFFVTANLRAWRDIIHKRWSTHADAEIQIFAGKVLENLRTIAPSCVSDIKNTPYE